MLALLLLPCFAQDPAQPPAADPGATRRESQTEKRAAARQQQRALDSAQRVMMAVFQEDKLQDLSREEMNNRLLAFDRDQDARVSFEEFQRLLAWSPIRAPRGNDSALTAEDAWALLLRCADSDLDAALTHAEALAFFDERDLDHDGVLTRNERPDGPKVGDKAPDFALTAPGGTELQSLSALLKEGKPVALLFGSYT